MPIPHKTMARLEAAIRAKRPKTASLKLLSKEQWRQKAEALVSLTKKQEAILCLSYDEVKRKGWHHQTPARQIAESLWTRAAIEVIQHNLKLGNFCAILSYGDGKKSAVKFLVDRKSAARPIRDLGLGHVDTQKPVLVLDKAKKDFVKKLAGYIMTTAPRIDQIVVRQVVGHRTRIVWSCANLEKDIVHRTADDPLIAGGAVCPRCRKRPKARTNEAVIREIAEEVYMQAAYSALETLRPEEFLICLYDGLGAGGPVFRHVAKAAE